MGFKVLENEVNYIDEGSSFNYINYNDDGGSFDDQPVATLTVTSAYATDAADASALATTTSARTLSPFFSVTPRTTPSSTSIELTRVLRRRFTPSSLTRDSRVEAREPNPPFTCHAPNASSTKAMVRSTAGTFRGSEPV